MDNALATDGYFFSSEPFISQAYIEAVQLACLLGANQEQQHEVILEACLLDQSNCYQLALTGNLQVVDQCGQIITAEQLRHLPLEQLNEQQFIQKGWIIREQPRFVWFDQLEPLNRGYNRICSCAVEQLTQLKLLLSPADPQQALNA